MPKQKDLKRLVRARMVKTGEAYTAARLQLIKKFETNYAALAGISDASVRKATGRSWTEWVRLLDASGAAEKSHRDIARFVAALPTPSWWSQMVTVGYERIRGLRARGQQRSGIYRASKSRTFHVPVETLFRAFANAKMRTRWLEVKITVRSATPLKRMRIVLDDGTPVQLGFVAKGDGKSSVSVQHEKLRDKPAADAMKRAWAAQFDALARLFAQAAGEWS